MFQSIHSLSLLFEFLTETIIVIGVFGIICLSRLSFHVVTVCVVDINFEFSGLIQKFCLNFLLACMERIIGSIYSI